MLKIAPGPAMLVALATGSTADGVSRFSKFLHVIGATVLLRTDSGIAFFMAPGPKPV